MSRTLFSKIRKRIVGYERWARLNGVTVGSGCRVYSDLVTTEPWLVSVGDRVTISFNVTLITHDGSGWLIRDARGRRFRYAPIKIGSDVFIGAGSYILPGVEIGHHSVVGAGSVVTKSVPPNTIVAGVPAKAISSWEEFESRALKWRAEKDKVGATYREQVDSVVEPLRPVQ